MTRILSEEEKQERRDKKLDVPSDNIPPVVLPWFDETKPLNVRKALYKQNMDKVMNPINQNEFDPETWQPMGPRREAELAYRPRIKPPKQLPTQGLNPKETREGQMIGMFESKQDLYLIIAHRCNDLQQQVDDLQTQINNLNNKK